MKVVSETDVVKACRTLFGRQIDITSDFIYYSIQPSGVKSAYRQKAKENHPDLFATDPLHIQQQQTTRFREILEAYDVLNLFFKQRESSSPCPRPAQAPPRTRTPENRTTSASRAGANDEIYYRGVVPQRTLQIGQYLYYRGKIPFGVLIRALVWQRKQRPTIGDIAVQWGLLNTEAIDRIFNLCGKPRLFGEKAVELGLLTVFQVNTILLYQRSQQDRLGKYFIENNILGPSELEILALELKKHNASVLADAVNRRRKEPLYA